MDPNFVLTLKPRVFKLEGSSFEIRPSIYVIKGCYKEIFLKVAITDFAGEGILATNGIYTFAGSVKSYICQTQLDQGELRY